MERRTQQERREEARRVLIGAAAKLFGIKGYAGTTLAEIGRQAGVSRSLVTYHFGSKLGCMEAVLHKVHDDTIWLADLETADLRGLQSLERIFRGYLGAYLYGYDGGRTIVVSTAEAISSTPELRALTASNDVAFRALVGGYLVEAIDDDEIPADTDVDAQATLVMAILRGVSLQWLVDPGAIDLVAVIDAGVAMLRAGLGAAPVIADARADAR